MWEETGLPQTSATSVPGPETRCFWEDGEVVLELSCQLPIPLQLLFIVVVMAKRPNTHPELITDMYL